MVRRGYHLDINVQRTSSPEIPVPHVNPQVSVSIKSQKAGQELVTFNSQDIRRLVDSAWQSTNTEVAYNPSYPSLASFQNLSEKQRTDLDEFLSLARDFTERGHGSDELANTLRSNGEGAISALEACVKEYFELNHENRDRKTLLATELHNMFINVGWLEKYWMVTSICTSQYLL